MKFARDNRIFFDGFNKAIPIFYDNLAFRMRSLGPELDGDLLIAVWPNIGRDGVAKRGPCADFGRLPLVRKQPKGVLSRPLPRFESLEIGLIG